MQVTKATVLLGEGLLHDAVLSGQWKDPAKAAEFAIATALAFDALCDEGLEVARNAQTNATPVKRKVTRKARQ